MRIHAEHLADNHLWRVWHCQQCRYLWDVQWADDDWQQYGKILSLHDPFFTVRTIQAQQIVIIPEAKIVYINPPLDLRELVTEEQEALCQSGQ